MKYVVTKSNEVRMTPNNGEHKYLAPKSDVKSAGYFKRTKNGIKTYDKSHTYEIYPKKGDDKLIAKTMAVKRKITPPKTKPKGPVNPQRRVGPFPNIPGYMP